MSNTITAYFKGRIGVAESVYQNDYGIVMAFDSIDLPAHFDCYFSRLNQEEALPGLGADNRVTIPNSILANPGNVTIHIPLHTGEDDSEVEYVIYFKVIGRARPIDDGTPAQMTAIERALALLSQPITNIEEIVNEALSFTGDTFDEMKAELQEDFDNYTETLEGDLATWKGGVESDIDDVEHDFTVLQNQFDTAVAAVSTDTELTDIRVGDDEVTYTTAGLAVRTQFANLKSDLNEICDSITNDLIASAYRKDGYYVQWDTGDEYTYEPFCDYRIYVTEDMIGKRYMLTLGVSAQVVFFNTNVVGSSNRINGINYCTNFVIPQNTKMITISLEKTTSVACTPYLFPISSPVVNADVDLSANADYKTIEDYVTIDTNDLRYKAQMVEGAYVSHENGVIYQHSDFRYYIIHCDSDMIGKVFTTTVGQNVTFFDSTGVFLSGVDTNHTTPQFTFTVPSDTEYIVVSSGNSTDSPVIPHGESYRFSKVLADDIKIPTDDDAIVKIDTNDLRHGAQVFDGAYVSYENGVIYSHTDYKYYEITCTSDMIGKMYNTTIGHQVAFFDSNRGFISGVDTNHTTPLFVFTVPQNTAFITVSSHVDLDTPVVPNGEAYHYSKHLANDIVASGYTGMKYCAIGDSITFGDLAELPSTGIRTPYHLVASNMLGLIDINKGVSGSRMAVTDEPDVPPAIVTRVLQLDGTEGYDFITVMGGTNDSINSIPVGTINDVVQTTFAGAINIICQHLKSLYPIGRIGFITPLRWNVNDSYELPYVEMMKAVCAKWGIPVYDAFHDSGISVLNISNGELVYDWQSFGYYGDELHPNWKGHEMFGRKVAEYLKTL